jgi:hypothetical protein
MRQNEYPNFNSVERLKPLLGSVLNQEIGGQMVHVLEPIFHELQAEAFHRPPNRFRIDDTDRALFELFTDMRNIEGFFLDYEDYSVHLERTVELATQLLDRGLTDVTKLDGYAEHMEELKKFYLDIQQNPKYRDQFKEFPRGN